MPPLKSKRELALQHSFNNLVVCLQGVTKYTAEVGAAMMDDSPRAVALKVAWHYLGTPYRWGGDDPISGFDCSGMIVEILQSVGIIARHKDFTAQGLWGFFSAQDCEVDEPYDGCLVFWSQFPSTPCNHVEMCLNEKLSIGASGGGKRTRSLEDAIAQNAFIKIRPFQSRKGIKGFMDPFKK